MRFIVDRTSLWGNERRKPLKSKKVKKELIKELGEKKWVIEINTLEDLLEFHGKAGRDIIMWRTYGEGYNPYYLEIYDDYRE